MGTEQIANLDSEKRCGSRFNIEIPSGVADLSPEASKRTLRGNSDSSSNLESKASPNLKSKSPWRLMMISFKVSRCKDLSSYWSEARKEFLQHIFRFV
ncbi:hypothetical protein LEP1GSC005_4068 [Leptospira santarosai str. ST188]|nr:hypothetical protein LEP1GSC005_4068 [Leptospira santarosai str. ST188]EMM75028.1 hypothetical protein LEP1GSC040_0513 [Leptospira santarosai str. 2000030832]EPG83715.1 hypothetical protein LEP1GSC048_0198 [Leptospira santarosai serovar Shermani str. 1342KT]